MKSQAKAGQDIKKMESSCDEIALLLKALSHPRRLLILGHLVGGEKTVMQLASLCGVSQSQMSQFLIRLKSEGLLNCRRVGLFQYYTIVDQRLFKILKFLQKEIC